SERSRRALGPASRERRNANETMAYAMKNAARWLLTVLLAGNSPGFGSARAATDACALSPYTVNLQRGRKTVAFDLPVKGSFVEESHYLTTEDKLPRIWPRAMAKQPKGEHAVQDRKR